MESMIYSALGAAITAVIILIFQSVSKIINRGIAMPKRVERAEIDISVISSEICLLHGAVAALLGGMEVIMLNIKNRCEDCPASTPGANEQLDNALQCILKKHEEMDEYLQRRRVV